MIIGGQRQLSKSDLLWDEKVVDAYEIGQSVQSLRKRKPGVKIGLYCGDFQELTPADCVFLQLCRSSCDLFVVVIPTDYSLRLTDKILRFSTDERAFRVGSLVSVQYISLFDEESCGLCIDKVDPDYIFHGRTMNDQEVYSDILQKGKIQLIEYPWCSERTEGRFFSV